jgi:hypothetical protein
MVASVEESISKMASGLCLDGPTFASLKEMSPRKIT